MRRFLSVCSVFSVVKKQATTEHSEHTEARHNRATIPFRVFRVFGGEKNATTEHSEPVNLAVGIGATGRGTFAAPEIQPKIQSVSKHQKHAS